jgi:hypothetical protein
MSRLYDCCPVFSRIDGPKIREEFYSALGTYFNLDLDGDTP